jgi:Flp pilus assembly protein TadD
MSPEPGAHADALEAASAPGRRRSTDPPPASEAVLGLHLQRFAAHMRAGDPHAAVRAASDACHAAPLRPEPHYAYGEAWLAAGEPPRAAQAFAAAVRLKPDWPDAWINLGIAFYRQGAIEDAKSAMLHALRQAPGHPVASANLGAFLRVTGQVEAAETMLRDDLARDPGNVGACLNLVADLQVERAEDALALLDAAPAQPVEPRALRHWLLQHALALLQFARPHDARKTLCELSALGPIPPALAPLWHWRLVLLAEAEGLPDEAAKHARYMEAALDAMGPEAVPEHRIMGHYDLAKYWSGQGDRSAAFAQWRAGHALLRGTQPFSREAHRAFVDANVALLDERRLRLGPHANNADAAPVFIVGMPRSGTTLCEQILAAHHHAHGAGERNALPNMFTALGGERGAEGVARIASLDEPALEAAAARYLHDLHALAPDKQKIIDKMPGSYLYLGLAALLFPGARFIHCVRDPRDIGLSIFTFRFHGAHGYAHDLADLGWTIAEQLRLMAHWRTALPGRILTVALSDWVHDFDGTLARLLGHLDLPPDPACGCFYELERRVRTVSYAQVRHPVNAHGLGRWRAFAAELGPLITELERAGALSGWEGESAAFATAT